MTGTIPRAAMDFPVFMALWNRRQRQGTPALHLRMARWLQRRYTGGDTRLLLMAFRSAGKSTILGLFCAWLLYSNPSLRIIVLAADALLARKMVRNVKRIIERHPATAHLKPDAPDQWASDRFTVRRDSEWRDPSMLARGLSTNMTGSRADIVICDDVEVPNTAATAEKRGELRARLAEISFVLTPGGTQLYVGTPHAFDTIYATQARPDIPDHMPFLPGFRTLSIPIRDAQGRSSWSERFPEEEIARIERQSGPSLFKSQMMLIPVSVQAGRIDWQRLQRYAGTLSYIRELGTLMIDGLEMVSGSAFWDPALGRAGRDGSVLAAVYTDARGHLHIHSVSLLETDPHAPEDEATQQCRAVASLLQQLHLPAVAIEINGIGRFLPAILRRELIAQRVPASVIEITSRRAKEIRILEAFEAPLAAHMLHAHNSVYAGPLLQQMQEWRPGAPGPDDALDAVAGAIALEPMRLPGGRVPGGPNWRRGVQPTRAQTDFNV